MYVEKFLSPQLNILCFCSFQFYWVKLNWIILLKWNYNGFSKTSVITRWTPNNLHTINNRYLWRCRGIMVIFLSKFSLSTVLSFFGPRYTYGPIYVSAYFIFVTNPTNIFVEKNPSQSGRHAFWNSQDTSSANLPGSNYRKRRQLENVGSHQWVICSGLSANARSWKVKITQNPKYKSYI